MTLINYLKQLPRWRLNQIANQHKIYYESDFSNLWIADKLKEKLLTEKYLKKIINSKLDSKSKNSLEKIINNPALNNYNLTGIDQLKKLGLIYKDSKTLEIPEDIKKTIKRNLQSKNNSSKEQKSKLKVKAEAPIYFNECLLLTLSYLQKNPRSKLNSYLTKINFSSLSTKTVKEKIFSYAKELDLLTKNKTPTSKLKDWTEKSTKELLLTNLNKFFPHRQSNLRKIIAVLIHYPQSEELPLSELKDLSLTNKDKQLLNFLNLFDFKAENLILTPFCWHAFNSKLEKITNPPLNKNKKTIVKLPVDLAKLWKICSSQKLIKVNNSLIFKQ